MCLSVSVQIFRHYFLSGASHFCPFLKRSSLLSNALITVRLQADGGPFTGTNSANNVLSSMSKELFSLSSPPRWLGHMAISTRVRLAMRQATFGALVARIGKHSGFVAMQKTTALSDIGYMAGCATRSTNSSLSQHPRRCAPSCSTASQTHAGLFVFGRTWCCHQGRIYCVALFEQQALAA